MKPSPKAPKPGPLPFKSSMTSYGLHQTILQRPKCAEAIGAIAVDWVETENLLATIYSQLIFGMSPVSLGGEGIALESFMLIPNIHTKLTILREAAKYRFKDSALIVRFYAALQAIQDAGDERNKIMHGSWALSDREPDKLIWTKPWTKVADAMVYGTAELWAVVQTMQEAHNGLNDLFWNEMAPILKTQSQGIISRIASIHNIKNGS